MNNMRRTPRRAGRRNVARSDTASIALQRYKSEQHGHQNRIQGMDPSSVNKRPYNTVKLHYVNDSDQIGIAFSFTVGDVVKLLLNQLGMATQTGTVVTIKLQRVDAWATSAAGDTLRPSVTADFSTLVPQVGDPATPGNAIIHYPVIKKLTDTGSVSYPARVSYSWPLSQRDIPMNANSDFTIGTFSSNTKETDVYFIVQWSTTDVAAPVA